MPPAAGFEYGISASEWPADLRLRPRGRRDRPGRQMDEWIRNNLKRPASNDHRSCFATYLRVHGCQQSCKEGIELCVMLFVVSISVVTYTISQIGNPVFQ